MENLLLGLSSTPLTGTGDPTVQRDPSTGTEYSHSVNVVIVCPYEYRYTVVFIYKGTDSVYDMYWYSQ